MKPEKTGLRLVKRNGTSFFRFPHLEAFADLQHAIFTRSGGYSRAPYRGLNVNFGQKDDPVHVKQNRDLVADCFPDSELVFVAQRHGTDVVVIEQNTTVTKEDEAGGAPPGDAIVTNSPQRLLVVQVADCQSVLFFDPVGRVAANAHCGWRGNIKNIIQKTIAVMTNRFGTHAGDIRAGIGPSLGPCCAEFINYKAEIPKKFWQYKTDTHHFDLWSLSLDQLCAAGVIKANICMSGICTRCRSDLFYSYRGEGITGRFAVTIGLR